MRQRHFIRASVRSVAAVCAIVLNTSTALAGDTKVFPGTNCELFGYEAGGGNTYRSMNGFLQNNNTGTWQYTCPAVNDSIDSGLDTAYVAVFGNGAKCYAVATAWTQKAGAFSPTKTHNSSSVGVLPLGPVATPYSNNSGSYSIACSLPQGAGIVQYFISE